jgi:cytidylate kinase
MAIITISRGSYSKGKEIAEKVAEKLGYECISRDILLEASEHYNIPEVKLVRALHDAPSVLNRFTHGKEKYVAFIRLAFLEHVRQDDIVYHGLAGHFFLGGVKHTLKVRIVADMEDRVRLEMEREGIPREKAREILKRDDEERRKWSLALYGIDTADPHLYDLVIHIRWLTVDTAVDLICEAARSKELEKTPESQASLEDLLLSARVMSRIVNKWPLARVGAEDGVAVVHVEGAIRQEPLVSREIENMVGSVEGLKELRVSVRPITLL